MTHETLPLTSILVVDRQRSDLGDIDQLADSITRFGLIQPIVVDQDHRLVAGGRRLAACIKLGWTDIPITRKESLDAAHLHEMELEENIRRKAMSWTEECLGIYQIHSLRTNRGALNGESWGQQQTAEMLGVSVGNINYNLIIARKLKSELTLPIDKRRFHSCDSFAEAWRLRLRDIEDEANAVLAERAKLSINIGATEQQSKQAISFVEELTATPDLLAKERERYEANSLNTIPFEAYWTEKTALAAESRNTLFLSNRFHLGDSIAYMHDANNVGRFNHIITDIPYAIDVEMMSQDFGGLINIDTIADEHDVSYNLQLIQDFFPAAFACTDDNAFVITWADQMLWQYMYDNAIAAGFAVQRWPITWKKTNSCKNACANYNTTKDTEIAIVCRKPRATIVKQPNTSVIVASNEELKKLTGHPFAKPRECWTYLADLCSIRGQTILDPFAGRGSCALSLLPIDRHVYSVELQVAHFNALLENVKRYYLNLNPKFIFKWLFLNQVRL